jgi:hypothetical protein
MVHDDRVQLTGALENRVENAEVTRCSVGDRVRPIVGMARRIEFELQSDQRAVADAPIDLIKARLHILRIHESTTEESGRAPSSPL